VRGIFAEPISAGQRALRRGWPVSSDDRIVLVDDILTSGASVRETVEAVVMAGGRPLAATVIVDRSIDAVDVGVPLEALARIEIASWEADGCPLCDAGATLEKPGSS
jgi:orotate phosphoribosyltransferase